MGIDKNGDRWKKKRGKENKRKARPKIIKAERGRDENIEKKH